MLPGLDGFAVLKQIRAQATTNDRVSLPSSTENVLPFQRHRPDSEDARASKNRSFPAPGTPRPFGLRCCVFANAEFRNSQYSARCDIVDSDMKQIQPDSNEPDLIARMLLVNKTAMIPISKLPAGILSMLESGFGVPPPCETASLTHAGRPATTNTQQEQDNRDSC